MSAPSSVRLAAPSDVGRHPGGRFAARGASPIMAVAVPAPLPASPPAPQRLSPRPRHLRSLSPHLLLVANGNASGLVRQPELVADAGRLLRSLGARVEALGTRTTHGPST